MMNMINAMREILEKFHFSNILEMLERVELNMLNMLIMLISVVVLKNIAKMLFTMIKADIKYFMSVKKKEKERKNNSTILKELLSKYKKRENENSFSLFCLLLFAFYKNT